MKVNEIMTGDYFRIAKTGKIIKILAVDEFSGSVDYFDGDAGGALTIGVEKIEPIPLTAEILEKNGFVDASSKWLEKWKYNNVYLNVYHKDNKVTIWRFMFRTGKLEDTVIYITMVHELQHALRLCGIDKTIEL